MTARHVGSGRAAGMYAGMIENALGEVVLGACAGIPFLSAEEREKLRQAVLRRARSCGLEVTTEAKGASGILRVRKTDGLTWADFDARGV